LASITSGAIALTIQYWMGSTHTIAGVNYADVWHIQLQFIGWFLILAGVLSIMWAAGAFLSKEPIARVASELE